MTKIILKRKFITVGLSIALVIFFGNAVGIMGKATIAQWLITDSWKKTLRDQASHKPWSWADTWPVAKLYFPKHNKTLYALHGGHGQALAFGPSHIPQSRAPEDAGTKIFGGHRDTHFSFLKDLRPGEIFLMQSPDAKWHYYTIEHSEVTDIRDGPWRFNIDANEIHLITCFPFNATHAGGPLRYVVTAKQRFKDAQMIVSNTRVLF